MSRDLRELLSKHVGEIGDAPLGSIHQRVERRKRRRHMAWFATAGTATAAVAILAFVLLPFAQPEEPSVTPRSSPTTTAESDVEGELRGELASGEPWTIQYRRAFCIEIGSADLGCTYHDTGTPVGVPYTASSPDAAGAESDVIELLFGMLPSTATDVVVEVEDGSVVAGELVMDSELGIWAMPVDRVETGEHIPTFVAVYLDATGDEIARYQAHWTPECPTPDSCPPGP